MATREQCEKRLRQMSKAEFTEIKSKFGGEPLHNKDWTESQFLDKNITTTISNATSKGKLDRLGILLGYPSDAESKRLDTVSAIRRSWIALGVSAIALLVSILVAVFK